MHPVLRVTLVSVIAVCVTFAFSIWKDGAGSTRLEPDVPDSPSYGLEGVRLPVLWFRAVQDREEALRALRVTEATETERLRQARDSRVARTTSPVRATTPVDWDASSTCREMMPPGFPWWIVMRESGGDPNARNPSGAYGCAQLMPMHLTGDYAADWARLWDEGRGACHWQAPRYCGG